MNLYHQLFDFSKSHWRRHFSCGFYIASTFLKRCDPSTVYKFHFNQKRHIIPMTYKGFYLSNIRCMFGMVRKNSTDLSQHDGDHDLSVRENALCVLSGALLGGTDFRLLTQPSEYVTISMILGTPVPRTTVSVSFRALRRTLPMTTGEVPSVGGSAMHMRWPDGIGREAGIGRTRSGDGLRFSGLARKDLPSVG